MTPRLLFAGCLNIDLSSRLPHPPSADDRLMTKGFQRFLGGMATNAACAARALGDPYSAEIQLFAPCGQDSEGDWLRQQLTQKGIDKNALDNDAKTHYCLILVQPDGRRLIVSEPTQLNLDRLPPLLSKQDAQNAVLYIDGFHTRKGLALAQSAQQQGWRTATDLDECDTNLLSHGYFTALCAAFNVIFLNQNTATKLQNAHSSNHYSTDNTLQRYSDQFGTLFLLTLAQSGVKLIAPKATALAISAPSVSVLDTTGAGDIFAGVFLAIWSQQWNAIDATQMACIAASLSTTKAGAQGFLPTAEDIQNYL